MHHESDPVPSVGGMDWLSNDTKKQSWTCAGCLGEFSVSTTSQMAKQLEVFVSIDSYLARCQLHAP